MVGQFTAITRVNSDWRKQERGAKAKISKAGMQRLADGYECLNNSDLVVHQLLSYSRLSAEIFWSCCDSFRQWITRRLRLKVVARRRLTRAVRKFRKALIGKEAE